MTVRSRRQFVRDLGLGAAALPFALGLPGLARAAAGGRRKQRLVVVFSPNGVVPKAFWPDAGKPDLELKPILAPLAPFKDKTLVLKGVCDKVGGDGDNHMRGIGCLLTGAELFPGNIQGGSHTPAGWCTGHSIDQEIRRFLQADPATRTRFGSLEFGALVPARADTWTRMVYAGPNQPVTPVDDPYQMLKKLYGQTRDRAAVAGVLDAAAADLAVLRANVGADDRRLLDQHATFVREIEQELKADAAAEPAGHPVPELEPGVHEDNDNLPKLSRMQLDLLVHALAADFCRVATFQYTNAVGVARMRWLGVSESHHELSHEPDNNKAAVDKLTKINTWFCEQIAYLCKKLAATPEPGGDGSMLDHTTVVWTNELGKGNSHTLDDIPFVLVGGGLGFKAGRAVAFGDGGVPHHRLLLALAHGFGHHLERFGNPDYCGAGPLALG